MQYSSRPKANKGIEATPSHSHFHGKTINTNTVAGFFLSETSYLPSQKVSSHSHERASFCLALQGGFTEDCSSGTRSCSASTLIFRPPAETHRNHFQNTSGRCFNIEIEPHWMQHVSEFAALPDVSRDFNGGSLPSLALRVYQEFRRMDEVSTLMIEGLALEMVAQVSRAQKRPTTRAPHWLNQAREFLHENFRDGWTLAAVAEAVGVHPVHLARVFRHNYHCSVGEYILKLRLEFCCRQLLTTEVSLAQLSLEAGFSHQSHFSAAFKRATGLTPTEYRAALRPFGKT